MENVKNIILNAETALGIEFGSTRIKSVLVNLAGTPLASGSFDWENSYKNGVWTYSLDEVFEGLQASFAALKSNVLSKYGVKLESVGSMGISGMMHGYLAFDRSGAQLAEFRTWRNTITAEAAEKLSALFDFNIPQRWSIAHLYQAILNGEEHVGRVDFIATLAAYVHYRLTGEKVIGVGEASGMFPIDSNINDYDSAMLDKFDACVADKNFPWNIRDILPRVLVAGENAGTLTAEGAALLDPTGEFRPGVPLCPPEGDAGTGMTATNSVRGGTGNISAGTSIFSMIVLDKPLDGVYPEIDVVATPDGSPVAMVHCNNCCSELDAWVKAFGEAAQLFGLSPSKSELYEKLYRHAMTGRADCGGVVAYNFLSGEPVAGAENGRPMYFRCADGEWSLANFMRAQLDSAFAALKLGMDILTEKEHVSVGRITGHGGLFKVSGAAQKLLADALDSEVSVMTTAGEGGAWGMAVLAAYMEQGGGLSLSDYLEQRVFADMQSMTEAPTQEGAEGFRRFMENWRKGLSAQYSAAN